MRGDTHIQRERGRGREGETDRQTDTHGGGGRINLFSATKNKKMCRTGGDHVK